MSESVVTLPTLLTLDEACEIVRLSPWAIRRAIARGELHAYRPCGRIRIPSEALAAWLEDSAPDLLLEESSKRSPAPRARRQRPPADSFRGRERASRIDEQPQDRLARPVA